MRAAAVISQTGGSPNFAWSAGDLAIGRGQRHHVDGHCQQQHNRGRHGDCRHGPAIAGAGDVTLANNTGSAGVVKPALTISTSGLAGSGLVLQNNGGDNLGPAVNGPFTFATPLLDGSAYAVSVLVQPADPPPDLRGEQTATGCWPGPHTEQCAGCLYDRQLPHSRR